MQFDHLMHRVPDLDAAVAAYRDLGFTIPDRSVEHPGIGTRSRAWRTGAMCVELITVCDPAEAQHSSPRAWPIIDALVCAGGGAGRFVVLVEDVAEMVAQARARGIAVMDPREMSARRADGSVGRWVMAGLMEGPFWGPFFINYGMTPAAWEERSRTAGHERDPWRLDHLVIETPEPKAGAAWLGRMLGLEAVGSGDSEWWVALPGCALRFVRGDADRVTEVWPKGTDAPAGVVGGLRFGSAQV